MEKFARLISIEGNYAHNVYGDTFFITNDLFPIAIPCVIVYNSELTSTIRRSEIMEDDGEELFYDTIVRHVERTFSSTEELAQYRRAKWIEENEIQMVPMKRLFGNTDFSELVAF